MTERDRPVAPPRRAYHHGNLASALADAALTLAREGGPEAVVLREAARRVGVSPSAAYRHFPDRQDLLRSVKRLAQEELADALNRATQESAAAPAGEPGVDPKARLRILCVSYVRFALTEPGLFRTAFCRLEPSVTGGHADANDRTETRDQLPLERFRPFLLLSTAVDQLVGLSALPTHDSAARITAWSAVHGLAALLLDGPLNVPPGEQRDLTVCGLVEVVVRGLAARADAHQPSRSRDDPSKGGITHNDLDSYAPLASLLRAMPQTH